MQIEMNPLVPTKRFLSISLFNVLALSFVLWLPPAIVPLALEVSQFAVPAHMLVYFHGPWTFNEVVEKHKEG